MTDWELRPDRARNPTPKPRAPRQPKGPRFLVATEAALSQMLGPDWRGMASTLLYARALSRGELVTAVAKRHGISARNLRRALRKVGVPPLPTCGLPKHGKDGKYIVNPIGDRPEILTFTPGQRVEVFIEGLSYRGEVLRDEPYPEGRCGGAVVKLLELSPKEIVDGKPPRRSGWFSDRHIIVID